MGMSVQTMGIALIILCVVFFLFFEYEKRSTFKKLHNLLARREFGEYMTMLDSFLVKYLYPKYNRLYMKLNGYLFMEDHEETQHLFDVMLNMRVSKKQRKDLVLKAFNYYVEQEDKQNAERLLEEIKTWEDGLKKEEACRIYDIFILKKFCYIDEMESKLEQLKGFERSALEYLLALQYENKGDHKKSESYLEASQQHIMDSMQKTSN